jgi:hypothetical protein
MVLLHMHRISVLYNINQYMFVCFRSLIHSVWESHTNRKQKNTLYDLVLKEPRLFVCHTGNWCLVCGSLCDPYTEHHLPHAYIFLFVLMCEVNNRLLNL